MSLLVKLVPVKQFLVQNATTDTVQARWASVKGATGYRLTWASPGTSIKHYTTPSKIFIFNQHHSCPLNDFCCSVWFPSFLLICFAEGHIENINLGDTFNFYMIQGLHAGSEYTVTINPIFGDTEGPVTSTKIKTCKCKGSKTKKRIKYLKQRPFN